MSRCPFGHDSKNTLPDFSTALPVQVGLDYITRMFWGKYEDLVTSSYDQAASKRKKEHFSLHREALRSFVEDNPSFQGGKLLDTIYFRAIQKEDKGLPTNGKEILALIRELREKISKGAKEVIKPGNVLEYGVADNIIGPLAPWECTITSIFPFYKKHGGTEVFAQAWKTITQVNTLIGTHLATKHISSVGNELVSIISDSDEAPPFFLIAEGVSGQTQMTWRPHAIPEITTQLDAQDWEKIINNPKTRKGPLTVCPAAHVKTPNGTTIIEMGVEKIGNVLLRALFS